MRGFDAAVADETPASPSLTVANCLPQFALTVEIHRYSQRHFLITCDTCRRVDDMQNMPCFPNQKPRARAACCRPWPWRASATPLPPWRRRSSRWRPRAPRRTVRRWWAPCSMVLTAASTRRLPRRDRAGRDWWRRGYAAASAAWCVRVGRERNHAVQAPRGSPVRLSADAATCPPRTH